MIDAHAATVASAADPVVHNSVVGAGLRLLHQRVTLYLKVLFFVHVAFVAASVLASVAGFEQTAPSAAPPLPVRIVGYLLPVMLFAGWQYCARRSPVRPVLVALETGGTLALASAYLLLTLVANATQVVTTPLVLIAIALTLRAAVVPSPTGRTLLLGTVAIVALVGAAVVFPRPQQGWFAPLWLSVLGGAFVAITAVTSRVIYGLQREVRAAARMGQYELQHKVGEGGMGVVYVAQHVMLRRPTAIKLLPVEKAGAGAIARFEREVVQTSRLEHPNSVSIYDYGRTDDGVFYYAMEYLVGFDLEELVDLHGPIGSARTVHLVQQAAHALAEAQDKGLVHRDIKLSNIMVCKLGGVPDTVKVLDFGLVKVPEADSEQAKLTGTHVMMGTPHYMAPEMIVGEPVGPPADVYALGVVMYALLTGREPFDGNTHVEVCAKHLNEEPTPLREVCPGPVDPDLERLVLRCLAKRPDARPRDGAALVEALGALQLEGWTREQMQTWWTEQDAALSRLRGATDDASEATPIELGVQIGAKRVQRPATPPATRVEG